MLDGRLGLDLFADEYIQDPYPLYQRILDAGSVHRIGESDFYAVCGWDAVNDAVARADDFSSNLTAPMTFQSPATVTPFAMGELRGPTQALASTDEPAHAAHSTQHAAHSTQHTAHSTQHTAHSTQHTAHRKSLLPPLAARRTEPSNRSLAIPSRDVQIAMTQRKCE